MTESRAGIRGRRYRILMGLGALVVGVLAVALLAVFTPILDRDLESQPDPAADYDAAMQRAGALAAKDGAEVNQVCRSRVIDQGERTERAVVLLHGFTNCPAQFDAVAQAYADAGYSVVIPRLPGHGEQDRLTSAPSDIAPDDLIATADDAVDIAAGLGEQVTVLGLSGGGTMASWVAAQRDEVSEAVIMAPLVGPKVVPDPLVAPLARISRFMPDFYLWWDGSKKAELASPPYAYPRYSLRTLGAFLAIGRATEVEDSRRSTPLDKLVVVTNENDAAVSNAGVSDVERQLDHVLAVDHPTDSRVDKVFPADAGYKHDLIDPQGENAANLPAIYAQLGPLLGLSDLAGQLK